MKKIIALGMTTLLLSGCAGMNVPETLARNYWQGRPAAEVIDYFGAPQQIGGMTDKQWVVLVYGYDTSYTTREALGTYTGPVNGQVVHQEYWGDVFNQANCEMRVAINRDRRVDMIATKGSNCGSIDLVPN